MKTLLTLAGLPLALMLSAGEEAIHEARFIFPPEPGRGHVHASSIVQTPDGGLLAVWYENGEPLASHYFLGRDEDKRDDVRIGGSRLKPGAGSWDEPFVISDTAGVSDNNPALAIDSQQRLWLVHATLLAVPERTWGSALLTYKVSSNYEGEGPPRWDRESILVVRPEGLDAAVADAANQLRRSAGRGHRENIERAAALLERLDDPFARRLGWMPRVHPLALPDGRLLVPLANENFDVAAMAFTDDGGDTWTFSRPVPGLGVTQPSVVHLGGNRLAAFFRDATPARRIHRSESRDGGRTWSAVSATDLPNPGSGIEAAMLRNGRLAMIYNDQEKSPRDRLAVSISTDEGRTWRWTRHLESTSGQRFDYPSLIQAQDGSLHATYSHNLETIKHVRFNEAWVQQGDQATADATQSALPAQHAASADVVRR